MDPATWSATAAYLYVLRLQALELAWEYLRRNADYRRDWERRSESDTASLAQHWGLQFLCDPALDSRASTPMWAPTPSTLLHLTSSQVPARDQPFSLWNLPGRKSLLLSNIGAILTLQLSPAESIQVLLGDALRAGDAFLLAVPSHDNPAIACAALTRLMSLLQSRPQFSPNVGIPRPSRDMIRHMHTLQALDGDATGATHKEIAQAVFGAEDVFYRWTINSELRAQVRYMLRRGRQLMGGEYRDLLTPARHQKHGGNSSPSSSP